MRFLNIKLRTEGAAPVFHPEFDVEFVSLLFGNCEIRAVFK